MGDLVHDGLGRLLEPEPMPEHIKDAIGTAYGLLWQVVTTDQRIHKARRELLQWLTKDEQQRGIQAGRDKCRKYGLAVSDDFVMEGQ